MNLKEARRFFKEQIIKAYHARLWRCCSGDCDNYAVSIQEPVSWDSEEPSSYKQVFYGAVNFSTDGHIICRKCGTNMKTIATSATPIKLTYEITDKQTRNYWNTNSVTLWGTDAEKKALAAAHDVYWNEGLNWYENERYYIKIKEEQI